MKSPKTLICSAPAPAKTEEQVGAPAMLVVNPAPERLRLNPDRVRHPPPPPFKTDSMPKKYPFRLSVGATAKKKSRRKVKFFTKSEVKALDKARGKTELSRVWEEIEKSRGRREFLKLREDVLKSNQRKDFRRQWRTSNGFDVGSPPRDLEGAPLVVHEHFIYNLKIDTCYKCVHFAIKSENNDKKSNLELVEIVKYNLHSAYLNYHVQSRWRGEMYYLTFKAKEKEGREDVYQAKVFLPKKESEIDYKGAPDMKVLIFRKKPSQYQQSKGVEKKHERGQNRCRCGEKKEGCGKGGRSCDGGSNVISKTEEKQVGATSFEERMREVRKEMQVFGLREEEEFRRQWNISGGFDVEVRRLLGSLPGDPIVIREDIIKRWRIDTCFKCADLAIKSGNNDKITNLELVKYNVDDLGPQGEMYYLTFGAKGREDVYQAKVFNPKREEEEGEMKLVFFRKKPIRRQHSKGAKKKDGCGEKKAGGLIRCCGWRPEEEIVRSCER